MIDAQTAKTCIFYKYFNYNNRIIARFALDPTNEHLPVASLGLLRVNLAPVQLVRRRLDDAADAGLVGKEDEAKTAALLRVRIHLDRDIFHLAKTSNFNNF